MVPQGDAYNVDWVWSRNSNVHVATHRDWFISYTPFQTTIYHLAGGAGIEALGIGDVELEVRRAAKSRPGKKSSRKIMLRDVLYAPNFLCNVLGQNILDDYSVITTPEEGQLIECGTGATVGLIDSGKLLKLWLKGQRKGQTSLEESKHYWINAQWGVGERLRWEVHKETVAREQDDASGGGQDGEDRLTAAEKAFLKDHYGNEFKFLMQHGLSIHKEDDREEGRDAERARTGDDEDIDENDSDSNSFLDDLESDPLSHFADRFFTEAQLDWIEKYHRHSGNFLFTHGLKAYDDDDCREGAAIAEALMGR